MPSNSNIPTGPPLANPSYPGGGSGCMTQGSGETPASVVVDTAGTTGAGSHALSKHRDESGEPSPVVGTAPKEG